MQGRVSTRALALRLVPLVPPSVDPVQRVCRAARTRVLAPHCLPLHVSPVQRIGCAGRCAPGRSHHTRVPPSLFLTTLHRGGCRAVSIRTASTTPESLSPSSCEFCTEDRMCRAVSTRDLTPYLSPPLPPRVKASQRVCREVNIRALTSHLRPPLPLPVKP